MRKVLLIAAVFGFVATPAFAARPFYGGDFDVNVISNRNNADVDNNVTAISNTGLNAVAGNSGDVKLKTGNAGSFALAQNKVNTNSNIILDGCGCHRPRRGLDVDVNVISNRNNADIDNHMTAVSNTGLNAVEGNGGEYWEETTRRTRSNTNAHLHVRAPRYGVMGHGFYHHSESSLYNREVSYPMGGDVNVKTGDSYAEAGSVNVVNTNVNRVYRGGMAL